VAVKGGEISEVTANHDAVITVESGATVTNVTANDNVTIESGTVQTVTVPDGAENVSIAIAADATVKNLTVNEDVAVENNGTIEAVSTDADTAPTIAATGDNAAQASTDNIHTHTWVKGEEKEATCDTAGSITYTCSANDCPVGTKTEVIAALGHDYVLKDSKDATATEDGYETYVCNNDPDHTYTNTIPATGSTDDSNTGDDNQNPDDNTGNDNQNPDDNTGDNTENPDDNTGDNTENPDDNTPSDSTTFVAKFVADGVHYILQIAENALNSISTKFGGLTISTGSAKGIYWPGALAVIDGTYTVSGDTRTISSNTYVVSADVNVTESYSYSAPTANEGVYTFTGTTGDAIADGTLKITKSTGDQQTLTFTESEGTYSTSVSGTGVYAVLVKDASGNLRTYVVNAENGTASVSIAGFTPTSYLVVGYQADTNSITNEGKDISYTVTQYGTWQTVSDSTSGS
jgi:hypothetical protein